MSSSKTHLKIALVAPLVESVPPRLYGGTERIVSHLASALVSLGHSVTLFASGDSVTSATLHPTWPHALRLYKASYDTESPIINMIETVAQAVEDENYDVVHLHNGFILVPLLKRMGVKHLVTLHHGMDLPEIRAYRNLMKDTPVVSISDNQRKGEIPDARYLKTIYHGIPPYLPLGTGQGGYLAFLGRIAPAKGCDTAIRIAQLAGLPIKIAAKIDVVDQEYFDKEIKHLFELPFVDYIGEIVEEAKGEFLGNAKALLFPVRGEEPFGMVMVEAMMCGTPVVAIPLGSVEEVIDDGVTGFLVGNVETAVLALEKVGGLSRAKVREVVMGRFLAERMAEEYVGVYRQLLKEKVNGQGRYQVNGVKSDEE